MNSTRTQNDVFGRRVLTLVLPVGNVQMGLGIPVLLGETEVDDVDLVPSFPDAHEEVVGLDIPVDKVARVDVLDTRDLAIAIESESVR